MNRGRDQRLAVGRLRAVGVPARSEGGRVVRGTARLPRRQRLVPRPGRYADCAHQRPDHRRPRSSATPPSLAFSGSPSSPQCPRSRPAAS